MAREFGGKIYDGIFRIREVSSERDPSAYVQGSSRRLSCKIYESSADKTCVSVVECVYKCPPGAIDRTTYEIDEKKCIRCFACVRVCCKGEKITLKNAALVKKVLETAGGKRKEPEWQII